MRINRFIARCTILSRRAADVAIAEGRVRINGALPDSGTQVAPGDSVTLDGQTVTAREQEQTILFNKPAGFVVSRDGQGSRTVYDLLPADLHHLQPVGRLDKDSSGLLLLTTDGALAEQLTHPRYAKRKVYEITLSAALSAEHQQRISETGVPLDDGISKLGLQSAAGSTGRKWVVSMTEGRNRQIRRTFAALGYKVTRLHRIQFGNYILHHKLEPGSFQEIRSQ